MASPKPPGWYRYLCLIIMCTLAIAERETTFDHDLNFVEEETGGRFKLKSLGKLSDVIDLDQEPSVKRVLCKGLTILVAVYPDKPEVDWDSGHLVIGSNKWKCQNNAMKPGSSTIYAKIDNFKRPKNGVIELITSAAGPLDMFEEADIQFHYEQTGESPSSSVRHKRRVSNPLQKVLQDINWNASLSTDIPFNEKDQTLTDKIISVYKNHGTATVFADTDEKQASEAPEFLFRCLSCHGNGRISYHFELKVTKIDRKSNILKYMMQVEIDSTLHQNFTLHSTGEQTLTRTSVPWMTGSKLVFKTPVASFRSLPSIDLVVSYSSQANLEVISTTRGAVHHNGHLDIQGKTVITQRYEKGRPAVNEAAVYNWSVSNSGQDLRTNSSMNSTFAFFQNVSISPSISWGQRDVDMILGQPVHVSLRPSVNLVSRADDDAIARCNSVSVSVDCNVSVAETDFSVEAFNIHIWNVKLADPLVKEMAVMKKELLHHCTANCHSGTQPQNDTLEFYCGTPEGKIVRGESRFTKLHQLHGDFILFTSEEYNSTWCGRKDRPCVSCTQGIVGETAELACADSMMTSELASAVTLLGRYAKVEWPNRKLIVQEAWDEPTSRYPDGEHGDTSLFYEGRAARVAMSLPSTSGNYRVDIVENESPIIARLAELAACSGFRGVKRLEDSESLNMCVTKTEPHSRRTRTSLSCRRRSGELHHADVSSLLDNIGSHARQPSQDVQIRPGTTFPDPMTFEESCGGPSGRISLDQPDKFNRLIQYRHSDIEFAKESSLVDTWCGVENRRCGNCDVTSDLDDIWSWCTTRTMSMRLAARLKRLSNFTRNAVKVEQALCANCGNVSELYAEGRAARISMKTGTLLTMSQFASLAAKAGFDSVRFTTPEYIEVCVKQQDSLQAIIVHFPLVNLVGVAIPVGAESELEYGYPKELEKEPTKPLLFDADSTPDDISYNFKLHQIVSPSVRYFRFDSVLMNLLELAYDAISGGFRIIPGSAYRPRSVNINNVEARHPNEIHRYQTGQAVELQPNSAITIDSLFDVGVALMRVARTIRSKRLGIGLGAKADRLYLELRPLDSDHALEYLDVWDSGNTELYKRFKYIQDMVYRGGSILPAIVEEETCKTPELGAEFFYFGFDLDQPGFCPESPDNRCDDSYEHRYNVSMIFQESLIRAAGPGRLPRPDIRSLVQDCVVDLCGGCPEAGEIWKQKVVACTKMIMKYLSRASMPFQPLTDKVSIFNTDNDQSSVHSLACRDGRICVENTQIYSLLLPLISATYRWGLSVDLLFGGTDNPTPLLEIVEQELAWQAKGTVHVYIDGNKDVSALRNSLKILMIFNKNVTDVEFHIDPDLDKNDVMNTIQRHLEEWSGSTCGKWTRLVIPPYKFISISHHRKRRSLERSKDRNKVKDTMNNWEVNWMLHS